MILLVSEIQAGLDFAIQDQDSVISDRLTVQALKLTTTRATAKIVAVNFAAADADRKSVV